MNNTSAITLFLLLFARLMGFFLVSPLFSRHALPKVVLFGVALVCSLLITPPLSNEISLSIDQPLLFILHLAKELAVGYLLGFLFSLLFEAAAFAGQLVGTLMGFSATELLDPLSTSQFPLMAKTFSLILFVLFLALDLHHPLLRILYDSFDLFPLGSYPFTREVAIGMIDATGHLFSQALSYAMFPFLLLCLTILLFAIVSRFFQIFWIGFPIQLLIGFGAIALTVGFFGQILEHAFYEFWTLTKKILFPL